VSTVCASQSPLQHVILHWPLYAMRTFRDGWAGTYVTRLVRGLVSEGYVDELRVRRSP